MRTHREVDLGIPGTNAFIIYWGEFTGLDWHNHGDSEATIVVLSGALTEEYEWEDSGVVRQDGTPVQYYAQESFHVPVGMNHKVYNESIGPAISLHVYTPPLTIEYDDALELDLNDDV